MFPELKNRPTARLQLASYGPSSTDVIVQLRTPERNTAGRLLVTFPATVPEAAVDEYGHLTAVVRNIRSSRHMCVMDPIPRSLSPQQSPDHHFWGRISTFDAGHDLAASLFGEVIDHLLLSLETLPKDTFEPVNKGIGEKGGFPSLACGPRSLVDDVRPACTAAKAIAASLSSLSLSIAMVQALLNPS